MPQTGTAADSDADSDAVPRRLANTLYAPARRAVSDRDYLAGCFWALAVAVLGLVDLLYHARRSR